MSSLYFIFMLLIFKNVFKSTLRKAKEIRKYFTFLLLLLSVIFSPVALADEQNELGDVAISSNVVNYEEYLNDLLAKERFLNFLSSNVKIMISERGRGFKNDYDRYVAKYGKYSPILVGDYGYDGGSEGQYFNFKSKKEYDRFVEYLKFYNVKKQLKSYRKSILYNSSPLDVNAFFEQEFNSATRSYKMADFATSRLQFEDIYESYKPFYKDNLDEILFLWAESSFGLRYFSEARELYQKLIEEYPNSERKSLVAYKIIFMDYVYDNSTQFTSDYNKYKSVLQDDVKVWDKSLLVAATIEYRKKKYEKSINLLDEISKNFDRSAFVKFMRAAIYIELNDLEAAEKHFKDLTDMSVWPWSYKINAYLKNSAFLQLGYINYRRGNRYINEFEKSFVKGDTVNALKLRTQAIRNYEKAEDLFDNISKGYSEYGIGKIAKLWVQFKESDYRTSKKKIDEYFDQLSLGDDLYQALYLSGYMTQKRKPSRLNESLKDYYYVYNGMAANKYLKKYFSHVNLIRGLKDNIAGFVNGSVSPSEKKAASSLYGLIGKSEKLVTFEYNDILESQESVLSGDKKDELNDCIRRLTEIKDSLATNGFVNLASFAQKSVNVLSEVVKMRVQPISDDIKLFLEHATVFLVNEENDYKNLLAAYRKELHNESQLVSSQLDIVKTVPVKNEKQSVLVDYYVNNAKLIKNRNSALQTLFYEQNFYQERNIENTGTTAQYAFSGMIYEQIMERRKQIDTYRKVVGLLKNAARKKIEQLEFYLKEIDKDYTAGPGLRKVEELQKEFDDIYGDFRRAFFEGTDHLKMSVDNSKEKVSKSLQ